MIKDFLTFCQAHKKHFYKYIAKQLKKIKSWEKTKHKRFQNVTNKTPI